MSETKICKQCQDSFEITDRDFDFYKRISPTFDGRTFEIPAPTICPACRKQLRMTFRNDRCLYSKTSDFSGERILSIYSPEKKFKVFSHDEWWSEKWNPLDYGQDFDFSRPFFDQFKDLQSKVPRMDLYVDNLCENCQFSNQITSSKNCYLTMSVSYCEDCCFSYRMIESKNCYDCLFTLKSELCYECIDISSCYNCKYSQECDNCSNSAFLYNCQSCHDCLFCANLRNKSYCISNEQYTKEEYEIESAKFNLKSRNSINEIKNKFVEYIINFPRKYANLVNTENCDGDNIKNSKNCHEVYDASDVENVSYSQFVQDTKDAQDMNFTADKTSNCFYGINVGISANNILFNIDAWPNVANLYYCDSCSNNAKDCFGCIGIRQKQYCILNKQYSKEEYEKKVSQIITHMQETGEWGEFFPMSLSPFGYNETLANEYFPLEIDEAKNLGIDWQSNDHSMTHHSNFYEPKDNISDYSSNSSEQSDLLSGILKCDRTGKAFKIQPQELAFYIQNNIPIPNIHHDIRHQERFMKRNPRKLWERGCMNDGCQNRFMTTYSPERPEKVYCESCYQDSII